MRSHVFAFLAAAVLASVAVVGRSQTAPDADGEHLRREGDELAAQGKWADAERRWVDAYSRTLPSVRDLTFRQPVDARMLDREALAAKVSDLFSASSGPSRDEADQIAYSHFGFFPRSTSLRSTSVAMHAEQTSAFFALDSHTLFLPSDGTVATATVDASRADTRNLVLQRGIVAHEMTHALTDQHFDLASLERWASADDDASNAVAALIEGDAMLAELVDRVGPNGRSLLRTSPTVFGFMTDLMMDAVRERGFGEAFDAAPLLLRERLMFPYVKGLAFCLSLTQDGSWTGVDRAYRDPPTSTEQILHPSKYATATRDEPTALRFTKDFPLPADSWELVKENTLGELQIKILLEPFFGIGGAMVAAAGWDGDTYRVYRKTGIEPAQSLLVWATTWDSQADANEFLQAFLRVFKPSDASPPPPSLGIPPRWKNYWSTDGGVSAVWRLDHDVYVIDRAPEESFRELQKWVKALGRRDKQFPARRVVTPTPPQK
ncbi:MAG: hypothetical protein HYR85_23855 [Planctomycetes bacterium]|nr:hypothetical protein [Planctomycetota bacterium]MBI3847210.1 hypothetical protein [Planctomycetota bacterium]